MMKPYIRLVDVNKGWQSGGEYLHILKGISLEIFLGQSIAVIGPSGSGKSTLLHILGLLTPADRGAFFFGERKMESAKNWWDRDIRLNIGIIFQDAKLIPNLDILENVAIPLLHRGIWPAIQKKRAMAALEKVSLGHRLRHKPNQLSGGELMRVAIARALVLEPKLILADEPTGTLDLNNGQIISDMLYDLVNPDTALVLVTHHPPLAWRADRVLEIRDGLLSELDKNAS